MPIIDVIAAKYVDNYRIKIDFEDGRSGIVDFRNYLKKGGAFSKLQDLNYFKSFHVDPELGTLNWNNEVDIAPETLYCEATQEPLPSWTTPHAPASHLSNQNP